MEQEKETKIWRQVFKKQIRLKMERYMERTQVETDRPKHTSWDSDGDHGSNSNRNNDVTSKTEYITRLTSLRDSLIDQEEVNLAQALERLRLHSITNKSHSNRLRMNASDYNFISAQPLITQRRNMISTVERFRQIRPKRHQPIIFPLQGRQMLDVPRPASEEPISNFGNATNRSDRAFSFGNNTTRHSLAKVDETVQSNLQRLIQRTSSIPNIGRKALKQQEDLEPKAKPLLNIRAKLQKQPGSQLASPFLLSTHEPPQDPENPQRSSDRDTQNLSPQAHKLGPVLQDDTLNMDVLHQYYQSYIDSGGSPSEPPNHSHSGKKDSRHSTHAHHFHKHRLHPVRFNGVNKHSQLGTPTTQYNSIVSGTGKVIALSDLPDIMPRTTYTYYSTTHSSSTNGDLYDYDKMARFPELQTSYRYHMGISDAASSTASGASKSWIRSVQRRKHNNSPVEEETPEGGVASDGKMKIVVDMPNIIFNAASPEGEGGPEHGQGQSMQPEKVLRKAMKQQEIRKKELNNLLEDVKELNMITEVMNSASAAHGT